MLMTYVTMPYNSTCNRGAHLVLMELQHAERVRDGFEVFATRGR